MSDPTSLLWRQGISSIRWRAAVFLLFCVGAGVSSGIIWANGATRPVYSLTDNLEASMGERQLAEIFAADAFFSILLAGVGLLIGIACWMLFHRDGWWVCLLAVLGAGITSISAWQVGLLVSPRDFEERLARAVGGELVPLDLTLHALVALLVAPFAAITPVMLLAAFAPEGREAAPAAELETHPDINP
ncbi:MAG: hypothetical protein ACTHWA_12500 [Arachnia sp.]